MKTRHFNDESTEDLYRITNGYFLFEPSAGIEAEDDDDAGLSAEECEILYGANMSVVGNEVPDMSEEFEYEDRDEDTED